MWLNLKHLADEARELRAHSVPRKRATSRTPCPRDLDVLEALPAGREYRANVVRMNRPGHPFPTISTVRTRAYCS